MWSGISAARLGARRIAELANRYGIDTFKAAVQGFMDYGEQVSLRALRELPSGRYLLEEEQDNGSIYSVAVDISDDEFTIDLRNNPDQDPGSYNICHDASMSAAQMIFKNVTDPTGGANGGSFRPLHLLTRHGSVFDASHARCLRRLRRDQDPAVRPRLALSRPTPRHPPTGRALCIGLRHVHRRAAPGYRAALHDRRATDRRLGRLRRRATAPTRSSPAFTATRSTARRRSPRRGMACTSSASR